MFGYITIYKDELKVKEIRKYKYYYCAACNELKKRYGRIASIFVIYEMVFTLILLDSFSEDTRNIKLSCQLDFAHIGEINLNKDILNYITWLCMYLTRWKMWDNWMDDKNVLSYLFFNIFFKKHNYKLDCERYAEIKKNLDIKLNEFYFIEKSENNFDVLLQKMGEIWKSISEYGLKFAEGDLEDRNYIGGLCEDLAKFLYCIDAFDDFDKDSKKNKYNPLLYIKENIGDVKENTLMILSLIVFSLQKKVANNNMGKNQEIIGNIITYGLEEKVKLINSKWEKKDGRSKFFRKL